MATVDVKPGSIALKSTDEMPKLSVSNVISPKEAFEAATKADLPAGVTLTGVTEPIKEPDTATIKKPSEAKFIKECWGGRFGCGVFGLHRFGFSCGSIVGWAYPIGMWNMWGAGMWGGGCGLGVPSGGLFLC